MSEIDNLKTVIDEKFVTLFSRLDIYDNRISAIEQSAQIAEEDKSRKLEPRDDAHGLGGLFSLSHSQPEDYKQSTSTKRPIGQYFPSEEAISPTYAADSQGEFNAISNAVQNVKLPPSLVLKQSRSGINSQAQMAYNIIVKSAKYVETTMKVLSTLTTSEVTEDNLQPLHAIQVAQLNYLQDELASTYVVGNFDQATSKMFRQLESNTSSLDNKALENLKRASDVSVSQALLQHLGRGASTGSGFRGRGRGPWRGRFGRGRLMGVR
jgi:hypothetical protein